MVILRNPSIFKIIFIFAIGLWIFGCSAAPVPPEVQLAEEQEHHLWRLGAQAYVPAEYERYRMSLRQAQESLINEKSRFVWFQDYGMVQSEFREVLKAGEVLQQKMADVKHTKKEHISRQIASLKEKIEKLKRLTDMINEGRLARKDLVKAELILSETESRFDKQDYVAAEEKLKKSSGFIQSVEERILPIFNRYADKNHINMWRQMANETIAVSKNRNIPAIIVDKSERQLMLYKSGVLFKTYPIGLGHNGFLDKRRAGDNSTPEGKYRVVKKLPASRYHKALLINYPNEEDRRNFIQAKKSGLIPAGSRIGGLIEIHGGGRDSMTFGCIALDNHQMDEIFKLVPLETPVTIVGAIDDKNVLSSAVKGH
jgi:hypothetical protein